MKESRFKSKQKGHIHVVEPSGDYFFMHYYKDQNPKFSGLCCSQHRFDGPCNIDLFGHEHYSWNIKKEDAHFVVNIDANGQVQFFPGNDDMVVFNEAHYE